MDDIGAPVLSSQADIALQQLPKKRGWWKWLLIGGGVTGVVVAGVLVFGMTRKVDYEESYQMAKETKTQVTAVSSEFDCANVVNFVDKPSPDMSEYNGLVEKCPTINKKLKELERALEKLGGTSGVKNDSENQAQLEKIQAALKAATADMEDLAKKLKPYQAWHEFRLLERELMIAKADEVMVYAVAQPLLNSDNATLRSYGEGWLEKTLAYAQAAWAVNSSNYSLDSSARNALKQEARAKDEELKAWIKANKPDMDVVGELNLKNLHMIGGEFDKLYELIRVKCMENSDSIKVLY